MTTEIESAGPPRLAPRAQRRVTDESLLVVGPKPQGRASAVFLAWAITALVMGGAATGVLMWVTKTGPMHPMQTTPGK